MARFSLTQLLMGVAFLAILFLFAQSEGCGHRISTIECLSFSPDGAEILVSRLDGRDAREPLKFYMADVSRTLSVLDSVQGRAKRIVDQKLMPGNRGPGFRLWRRGRRSATYLLDGRIVALDFGGGNINNHLPDGSTEVLFSPQLPAHNLAVSQSGTLLAASGYDSVTIYDTTAKRIVTNVQASESPFFHGALVAFSIAGSRIVAAGWQGVQVWDSETGRQTSTLINGEEHSVRAIATLCDGTVIICADEWVRRYNLTGGLVSELSKSRGSRVCSVSDDGRFVAFAGDDELLIHDVAAGRHIERIPTDFISALAFAPNSHLLALGGSGCEVSIVDVVAGQRKWSSQAAGRYGSPWTLPALLLAIWGLIAWRLAVRNRRQHPSIAARELITPKSPS